MVCLLRSFGELHFHPCYRVASSPYVLTGFLWLCLAVRVCCLEKEGETLARGGFGVILKTGYRDDKCWKDKACRVNTEYTETGNRLLALPMQRRWKKTYVRICKMLAKGPMHIIIFKVSLYPAFFLWNLQVEQVILSFQNGKIVGLAVLDAGISVVIALIQITDFRF